MLEPIAAPVAQMDQSNSLLKSRLGVRIPPGALRTKRTDSSKAEPPTFNRRDAGSSPARCMTAARKESWLVQ